MQIFEKQILYTKKMQEFGIRWDNLLQEAEAAQSNKTKAWIQLNQTIHKFLYRFKVRLKQEKEFWEATQEIMSQQQKFWTQMG
jgi:hypothetical protein